jgi:hypothetical protein
LRLRVAFHDLDRHVTVAGVHQQAGTIDPAKLPAGTWLFERGEAPGSGEAAAAVDAGGGGEEQVRNENRKEFLHGHNLKVAEGDCRKLSRSCLLFA